MDPAPALAPDARWITITGWVAVVAAMPTLLWRATVGLGPTLGTPQAWRDFQEIPGPGTSYVLILSSLQLIAALLTLVLIIPGADRLPGAGRRLPSWLVGGGALAGAAALIAICVMSVLGWSTVDPFAGAPADGWARLCHACYLITLLWPPALIITTLGYLRRRGSRSR